MLSVSALKCSQGVLNKLGFRYVCWAFEHDDWDEELWKSIRSANHINSWSFTLHHDTYRVVPLPESIMKLEIVCEPLIKVNLNQTRVNTLILNETNFAISRYDRQDYPDIQTLELRKMYLKSLIYRRLSFPNLENLTIDSPDSDLTGRLLFSYFDERNFLRRFKSALKCLTLVSVDNIDYTKLGLILSKFLLLTNLCFINISGIHLNFWKPGKAGLI